MEIGSVKPIVDPGQGVKLPTSVSGSPMEQEAVRMEEDQKAQQDQEQKKTENLDDAVDKLNKTALIFDRSLRFQVHRKTSETMVSVVDMNSEKVIREIPAKEVLDLVSRMHDYMGMIFDKKA